jgi:hypothetical protein
MNREDIEQALYERTRRFVSEDVQDAILELIAAERQACAKVCEEFARKWWKIHCDSNLHYSSTLKAHQDFCALQVAIRTRGNT